MSEEESQHPSTEITESMVPNKEFFAYSTIDCLESLIIDAFKGKGFQRIGELFKKKETWPSQKCSKLQLNQLDRLVNKEMDKNDFGNVAYLMKCIQHFFKGGLEEESTLIQQGLVPKMVLWFERATEFLRVKGLSSNISLMSLIEDFYDTALVICKCSAGEGKKQLLDSFIVRLGLLVMQKDAAFSLRLEALRTLNAMLDSVPREDRKRFHLSEELCELTQDLARTILEAGDYDIQVAISEALCRMMIRKWRENLVDKWFADPYLAEAFREIKDKDFETDCRKFLNDLNSRLGDKRSVYTFPCITAFTNMDEVAKPADDKLEKFWIDFNVGSHSVTFYINNTEGPLWDSIRLGKELISNYNIQESDNCKIFSIYLEKLLSVNNKEITKIKIHFDAQLDILPIIKRVLGEEKMKMTDDKEHANNSTVHEENTLKTLESTYAHWKKAQRPDQVDSLSDILSSQLSDQSAALKVSSGTTSTEKNTLVSESQINNTEAHKKLTATLPSAPHEPESRISTPVLPSAPQDPESKIFPLVILDEVIEIPAEETSDVQEIQEYSTKNNKQEKRNKKASPSKQTEARKKESFDFQNSPDSLIHETVLEAKTKKFTTKNTARRDNESLRKKRILSAPEMRQSVHYRKHLFSDTYGETGSSSHSERSWILEHQKRPLSKSADYSRRRPRTRSKLKVLPLSSESSPEEQKKKNAVNTSRYAPPIPQKGTKVHTKKLSVPGQELPGVSAFLTPGDSNIKSTEHLLDDFDALGGVSSPEYSGTVEKKWYIQNDRGSAQEIVLGAKRENSDLSAGSVFKKMKQPRREPGNEAPEMSLKPQKLFDSSERKKNRRPELSSSVEKSSAEVNEVFDDDQEEEPGESSIIAVFKRFTKDLKGKSWSRYKKMELRVQNDLKVSEQQVSTLLSQIHQYRLQKLDNFQKIVVKELKILEKESQELVDLEKNTVEFWKKQSITLNSFCDLQKQRLKSMSSHIEETVNTFEETVQQIAMVSILMHFPLNERNRFKEEEVLQHMEENLELSVTSNETA
uniref:Synaptonemal complex protein 2-like isoform X2 n=1 Tax=Geotrypetes seraphini TaxID=260995 RepID=A0A6P8QG32_GEOSA|nr:synaptonemal complex protein 2-like isoform X2 [Geotrypetes seraphini]